MKFILSKESILSFNKIDDNLYQSKAAQVLMAFMKWATHLLQWIKQNEIYS